MLWTVRDKRMLRRIGLFIALLIVFSLPVWAQGDALNLPADLYVLLNGGQIQRYGVGAAGVVNLTPAGLYIIDFGVDSLGQRIAFRTDSGLYIIDVASGGAPQQIEGTTADVPAYRGEGDTIAWSPNGDALVYTTTYGLRAYFTTGSTPVFVDIRQGALKGLSWSPGGRYLAAEAEQNVWWIYRRDGDNLVLTSAIPSSIGTAWISDGELVFAPAEGGLRLMNLDQANAQAVLLDESLTYRLPEIDTNGALVFFGRDPNDKNVPDGYGRLLRLARGASKLETVGKVPVALNGLRWAPGGSLLVAFQGGVIALYDPSTGLGFPLPMTDVVAYAWGPIGQPAGQATAGQNVATVTPQSAATQVQQAAPTPAPTEPPLSQPTLIQVATLPPGAATKQPTPYPVSTVTALTLSTPSFFLAPDSNGVVQVWKMAANGTPPKPLTGSGSDVNEFAVSPDGNSVAYVVSAELWLQQKQDQPKLLAKINSFAPVEANFSSDGTEIAYIDENSGVWIDVIAENAPQLIRSNAESGSSGETYRRPQFSPDGKHLLLDVYTSDNKTAVGVLDLTTRDLAESAPVTSDDPRPLHTGWLRDGRIYTFVDASTPSSVSPGLYVIDANSPGSNPAQWIPLPPDVTVRAAIEAVSGTMRLLLAHGTDAFAPLSVVDYDLKSGKSKDVIGFGSEVAPQFSPDGRFVGGYQSLTEIDGIQQGAIQYVDLNSGHSFQLSSPATAWGFQWSAP